MNATKEAATKCDLWEFVEWKSLHSTINPRCFHASLFPTSLGLIGRRHGVRGFYDDELTALRAGPWGRIPILPSRPEAACVGSRPAPAWRGVWKRLRDLTAAALLPS